MPATFPHDDALRDRIRANLAAAARRGIDHAGLRPAAVAIVLASGGDGESAFYLTLRPPRMSAHSGQYALPGGKLDPGESAAEAALRELHEELGLAAAASAVLGRLDDLPTQSGYAVTPFVIWLDGKPEPRPDPREVAKLHPIPLADLFAEDPGHADPRDPGDGQHAPGVFWLYIPSLGHRVYAPTAAMLWQFREVALEGRDAAAPHYAEPDFARR